MEKGAAGAGRRPNIEPGEAGTTGAWWRISYPTAAIDSCLDRTMRWKYYTPGERPREDAERSAAVARIDRWWEAFTAKAPELDRLFTGQGEWNLVEWMHDNLQAIDRRLLWEFGPGAGEGHRLVVTPEVEHHLRPLVDEIIVRAPALPGWSYHTHRVAESVRHLPRTIESRTGLAPAFTGVGLQAGEFNRVDVSFQFPEEVLEQNRSAANAQAFLAAELLLGEDLLRDWMGVLKAVSNVEQPLPPSVLRRAFTALAVEQRAAIPAEPFLDRLDTLAWTTVDLRPKKAADYVHRYDLAAAVTGAPELWRNAHSDQVFWSGRFSRSGETFCYLKIDRGGPLRASAVADRTRLEEALNETLRPTRLGCVIGGGSGRRYSYVDLALIDVPAAAAAIRGVLGQLKLPTRRAWIQFFDNSLATEWVGMWPDSPAPPMPFVENDGG